MGKNTYKESNSKQCRWLSGIIINKRLKIVVGIVLQGVSICLLVAFISYFLHAQDDQHIIESFDLQNIKSYGLAIKNWLGFAGAFISYYLIFRWLGVTAFFLIPPLYVAGHKLITKAFLVNFSLYKATMGSIFMILWWNILLGYMGTLMSEYTRVTSLLGGVAYELGILFKSLLGSGTFIFSAATLCIFLICFFNITKLPFFTISSKVKSIEDIEEGNQDHGDTVENDAVQDDKKKTNFEVLPLEIIDTTFQDAEVTYKPVTDLSIMPNNTAPNYSETVTDSIVHYDPTLDLSTYQYPSCDLLEFYENTKHQVTQEELAHNKDKIVETLINFKIGIASIKATIGPTVTLYEIIPEAGIKISKIKNLEDDIALNLAALGIRIIAPIPGKGTIGIEVPNKNREIVSLRAVLSTEKFMKSNMELPLVLGRSISNEICMADLTKMPHLLIAGATGQGKSVGLNVLLTSLIYKKHPSQLKLVLVDPKKVELSLYNTLERHFLAKLPDSEESIITETKKVIHTLNSLCIEMDHRYELLKEAGTRNIKEYNDKFIRRKLNPQQGHHFLPYIVLVIDEFADMMMTAGKEIEIPIARLAQLARAIGIHLILATQRPSVNVITGIIKANFPVRISYKVTSKIDSRTILDSGSAEQLVGQGDFLISMNSNITRLQCPFLETQEVERICAFVGAQRGYESAYLLPIYDENENTLLETDLKDKDPLFEEAARLIVMHQQGSTSLIQRKLKLGYNRAGRLIDQLEATGIVGPFEGSKAREVLISNESSLELLLKNTEK